MLLLLCGSASVRAQLPDLQLSFEAPEGCPADAELRTRIAADLARSPSARTGVQAQVRIESEPAGYSLALVVRVAGAESRRELRADSCDELTDAAALLIALAVDPSLVPAPAPAPAPPTPLRSPPGPPEPIGAQPGAEPEASRTLGVGGAFIADAGMLPGVGLGAELALALGLRPLRLALGGQLLVPTDARVAGLSDASVTYVAAMGILQMCVPLLRLSALRVGPCAQGELGMLYAKAGGIEQPRSANTLWLAGGAGLDAELAFGAGFRAALTALALIPQRRWRFWVESEAGPVNAHRVTAVLGRFGIGIRHDFKQF